MLLVSECQLISNWLSYNTLHRMLFKTFLLLQCIIINNFNKPSEVIYLIVSSRLIQSKLIVFSRNYPNPCGLASRNSRCGVLYDQGLIWRKSEVAQTVIIDVGFWLILFKIIALS